MSNLKYLEIDSTYRNRNQYPDPADFVVFLSQSGTKSSYDACDPVSAAAPIIVWSPDDYKSLSLTVQANPTNTLTQFIVYSPIASLLSKVIDYHNGQSIDVTGTVTGTGTIIGWDFLSTDGTNNSFIITITPSLSGSLTMVKVVMELFFFADDWASLNVLKTRL